jgi:uncharacterized membrane protein required for colicin V production
MWYDVGMLAIVAYTTIRGAAKGIAWQLAAIAALVLCFVFAAPLSKIVAPSIHVEPPLNRWIAMLGIYLAFSFACFGAARMLRGWLEAIRFEEYDRHLGALFGFLKGATFCLVVTFFVVCLSESGRDYVLRRTRAGRLAGQTLDQMAAVMPAELESVLSPYLRRFDDAAIMADEPEESRDEDDRQEVAGDLEHRNGFRGSTRPPEGLTDEDGDNPLASDTPRSDDVSEDREGDSPKERGVIERVIGNAGSRIRNGVMNLIRDSLSTDATPPARTNREDPVSEPAAGQPPPRDPELRKSIQKETESIGRVFSPNPGIQDQQRLEIEALLNGIPPRVSLAALRDWHADLIGARTDPDPKTDARAILDQRLIRALESEGVDLEELPRPVADRLRDAEALSPP